MLVPIHPSQSGKIERSFRTIKDKFINCTNWNTFSSLEDLNLKYNEFISSKYNNCKHSSIDAIPRDRYIQDEDIIKNLPHENIDNMFMHVEEKKVSSDALIRILQKDFETPIKYIKQRVLVKYMPDDLACIYIVDSKDNSLLPIYPVDKIANSKIKRNNVSYQKNNENIGG